MIYHLVPLATWQAEPDLPYTPPSIARDGYVHGVSEEAVALQVANAFFADDDSVVALLIDENSLTSEVRIEKADPAPPGFAPGTLFTHIYGPIERSAVVTLLDLQRNDAGCCTALVPRPSAPRSRP